ncbi:hypothetical protein FA15DRAFT_669823 [Coprinopsis marcescibilis]|uniref:Uncharacterized protein n=1 Tax=Coprinopsis marcescibilis TaxID=230819 RepID=A0A5C3KUR2_COPMA|nr:hypothetical protein FA15DRAFT_669823 [Coprinopsis marcescibilis]
MAPLAALSVFLSTALILFGSSAGATPLVAAPLKRATTCSQIHVHKEWCVRFFFVYIAVDRC